MKNLKFYSLATGAALAMGATPTQAATPRADKPNVIMILIDDLSSFGVSAYGLESITSSQKHFTDEKLSTPNIDKLAQEGVLCSHAYSHALSEATRVALMTGMNNGRNYIETKALHESQITYGDVFQANGYKTAVYGKWKQSRGSIEVPAVRHISAFGWDDYSCFDMVYANQRFINPDLVVNDKIENYNGRTDLDPATDRRWYGPDMFNRKTLEFIEKNQNDPFFIYYSLVLIHDDHKPTPDSKPRSVFDTTDESNKNDLREYFPDMIRYTDKMIGRVVDKVEELGLRDNTIIIVMGDNGSKEFVTFRMKDGKVHKGGKGSTTYRGEQVPLIFSAPKLIPAAKGKDMRTYEPAVDITDIYPTIMTAAGIEIPNANKIDGVSLWSQLQGKSEEAHRPHIYKWYNANNTQNNLEVMMRYAQTPDFKYYAPNADYPEGRFFDLRTDPEEIHGVKGRKLGWERYWYAGLDLKKLTPEQKKAYLELKAEVDKHAYTKVKKIEITSAPSTIKAGEIAQLKDVVTPSNATRNGVIWVSSDKSIATVDKFGRVKALKTGEVTITLHSWDDAWPVANGSKRGGYKVDGMKDQVKIKII